MNNPNQTLLQNFTIDSLPDLDTAVLGALELFIQIPVPRIDMTKFKRPLVVGSGNAEDPAAIKQFINQSVSVIDFSRFADYTKFYLIVPPEFSGIIRMLQVKFIELFGRNVARDIETAEYVRHATTIAGSDEIFISFGSPTGCN